MVYISEFQRKFFQKLFKKCYSSTIILVYIAVTTYVYNSIVVRLKQALQAGVKVSKFRDKLCVSPLGR